MIPPVFPGGSQFGQDYSGKTVEEYFQDYITEFPITLERLDDLLLEFFKQGYSDGSFQGVMLGFTEGAQDKANEIVQRMLTMEAMTIECIAEATGVDKDEVLRIKKSLEDSRFPKNNRKRGR